MKFRLQKYKFQYDIYFSYLLVYSKKSLINNYPKFIISFINV